MTIDFRNKTNLQKAVLSVTTRGWEFATVVDNSIIFKKVAEGCWDRHKVYAESKSILSYINTEFGASGELKAEPTGCHRDENTGSYIYSFSITNLK